MTYSSNLVGVWKNKLVASTLGIILSCTHQLPPVSRSISTTNQHPTPSASLESQCQLRGRSFWFRNESGQENLIDQLLPEGSRQLTTICRRNFAVVVTSSAVYNVPFDRSAQDVSSFYETSVNPPFSLDLRFAANSRSLFVLDHYDRDIGSSVHVISIDPTHRFDDFSCNIPNVVLSDQAQIGLIPGNSGGIVIAPLVGSNSAFSTILGKISSNRCGPFSQGDIDFVAPRGSSFFELPSRPNHLFFGNRQNAISFWLENGNYQAEIVREN